MSHTMYSLTTIKKSPIHVWDDSTVSIWIKSLSLDEEITMDLSTAVLINKITGANLLQAKTKEKMINLFKGGGNLGYFGVDVRVAQFLINAVRQVEMEYNARLLSNQQKFIQTNTNKMAQRLGLQQYDKTYYHQNANPADGWKSKKIEDWSMSDTQNWVNTLNLSLDQKQNILTGFVKGHRTGQYLLLVGDGMEIANDHIKCGNTISVELGELLYKQIKSLKTFRKKRKKQAEIKDADNNSDEDDIVMVHMHKDKHGFNTNKVGWWNKVIEKWSSEDVKEWIKSLKLKKEDEKLIIESIVCTGCTGADFKECTNGKDIAASFEYDFSNSKNFFNYLYKQLQNVIKPDANDVESDNDDVESDNNNKNKNDDDDIKMNMAPNGKWKYKKISDWSCPELQGWILSLTHLGIDVQFKLCQEIRNAEMSGMDFNGCTTADDITHSFENIDKTIGDKIYKSLEKLRKKTREYNNGDAGNYLNKQWIMTDSSRGIIGLRNSGNTCFINAVIQCLLQTPPLIRLLRTWPVVKQNKYHHRNASMLDSFIEIAQIATRQNAKFSAVNPAMIVSNLRSSDVKFEYGAQGDALSAISKMIELLDADIIARQKMSIKPVHKIINHPGSWYIGGTLDEENEEDLISGNLINYNPYKSIVRDTMHFVERNILSCMNPGCGYKESRYDIKEKILLPLHDHCIDIILDICIPLNNKYIPHQFRVLDYCCVDTLRHNIFKTVSNMLETDKNNRLKLQSLEQIKLKMIEPNKQNNFTKWIKDINPQNECKIFRKSKCIVAVIEALNNSYYGQNINVTTFNIFINEYGKVDTDKLYLQFETIPNQHNKLFNNMSNQSYRQFWYVNKQLISSTQPQYIKINEKNNVIVCLWIHINVKQYPFQDCDFKHFEKKENEIWKFFLFEKCKHFQDYGKCYKILKELREKRCKEYISSGYASDNFRTTWMKSLEKSIDYFGALMHNQHRVGEWTYHVFNNKINRNIYFNNGIVQTDICDAFEVYLSDKLLDRGAVLKCVKCGKKSDVFHVKTDIVKYPQILIFTIDRYNDGRKFENTVNYPHKLKKKYGGGYELYAVCNHSGSLRGGHYWSFIKGVDDNKWYNANDSTIKNMNHRNVINKSSAIILMYKQRKT